MQTFKSEYLFRRAEWMMKRKGYYAGVKREYCGVIEVEWRSHDQKRETPLAGVPGQVRDGVRYGARTTIRDTTQ